MLLLLLLPLLLLLLLELHLPLLQLRGCRCSSRRVGVADRDYLPLAHQVVLRVQARLHGLRCLGSL